MKKFYFTLLAAITLSFSANAQLLDIAFDFMVPGDVVGQNPAIVLWPASGVTSSQVTDEQAFTPPHSMLTREQAGGNVDDILVNLGNQSAGTYSVTFMVYVPAGATGFWNIQNDETFMSTSEAQWNGQFFIGATASGGNAGEITFDQDTTVSVPYPDDEWFKVTHVVDLDNRLHTVDIDGNLLIEDFDYASGQGDADMLGAINYFAIDANNRYFVDDFLLVEGDVLSSPDLGQNAFSVYPNPVQDRLNIESNELVDSVIIYDVLGKQVLNVTPNSISPQVDTSGLASGAYLVQVSINGSTETVKIIK